MWSFDRVTTKIQINPSYEIIIFNINLKYLVRLDSYPPVSISNFSPP